jgi:hypothetical protein
VRTTPSIVRLYFSAGIPAFDAARMFSQSTSISRSRSGLLPSMMCGFSDLEIGQALRGSGRKSSAMPKASTRSRSLRRSATSQDPRGPGGGGVPQMFRTPNWAK